jgi:hypothetical protein
MNPTRHTKNATYCRKYKLSDPQTKYYSPTEHLAFEIIVLCKNRDTVKRYILKKQKGLA